METHEVVGTFVVTCVAFGLLVGCVGLGAGLIFLTVSQAVGVGILSFGCGALFGMVFGVKWIMKALIETLKEKDSPKSSQ